MSGISSAVGEMDELHGSMKKTPDDLFKTKFEKEKKAFRGRREEKKSRRPHSAASNSVTKIKKARKTVQ